MAWSPWILKIRLVHILHPNALILTFLDGSIKKFLRRISLISNILCNKYLNSNFLFRSETKYKIKIQTTTRQNTIV